jgi:hypothetical protein
MIKVRPHSPSWRLVSDSYQECIVDNPGDARVGVSRPMIKKVRIDVWLDMFCLTSTLVRREQVPHRLEPISR